MEKSPFKTTTTNFAAPKKTTITPKKTEENYFQKARETQRELTKTLPRINDAPKKDESNFSLSAGSTLKSDTKIGDFSLSDDVAKRYKLPTTTERDFGKGLFGEKEEQNLYNKMVYEIFGPKKTERQLFLEGFEGKEQEIPDDISYLVPKQDIQSERENNLKLPLDTIPQSRMEAFAKIRDENAGNTVKLVGRHDSNKEPTMTQLASKKEQTMWFGDGTYAAEQQKVKEEQYGNKVSENAKMNGKSVWKIRRASDAIVKNAGFIKSAAKRHGVNPAILAACIYAEQANNVTITEDLEDMAQSFLGMDCSVGLGQVRVSTAKKVEDKGHMPKNYDSESLNYVFKNPFTGKSIYSSDTYSRDEAIYYKLKDPETNINYAAAYLAMIQNMWRDKYPVISGDTAILATLYNIGENGGVRGINESPTPNAFGNFAKTNYPYMQYLLEME